MAQSDSRPPLDFSASFPREAHFASTVHELASRLGLSAGLADEQAETLGQSVEGAYSRAVGGASTPDGPSIDISLRAGAAEVHATVTCGPSTLLELSLPRPR